MTPLTVFCIVDSETNETFSANGRSCWSTKGSAQNAWYSHNNKWRRGDKPKFKDQDRFVLVECDVVAKGIL